MRQASCSSAAAVAARSGDRTARPPTVSNTPRKNVIKYVHGFGLRMPVAFGRPVCLCLLSFFLCVTGLSVMICFELCSDDLQC